MPVNDAFHIYDTTLRDGAQQEGLNLSVHDKLNIARHLDDDNLERLMGQIKGLRQPRTRLIGLRQSERRATGANIERLSGCGQNQCHTSTSKHRPRH